MGSKPGDSKLKRWTLSLIFISLLLLLLVLNFHLYPHQNEDIHFVPKPWKKLRWYEALPPELRRKSIRIGLVNTEELVDKDLHGMGETVKVGFKPVSGEDVRWDELFPEWIDEDEKWGKPTCPEIPMPKEYPEVDLVVARVPCGGEGDRDVFRLQVNLVVANVLVRRRRSVGGGVVVDGGDRNGRTAVVVFIGGCEPMLEIFRCDDLLGHGGDYWIYKPNFWKLMQKVSMPIGSCQLHPLISSKTDQEVTPLRRSALRSGDFHHPREAYVTVLHSSEAYVCGAIALAQSIIQSNSTKDLVLLADDSISGKSLRGLRAAGWKIRHIERIRSPHAEKDAYNEWNYSKLRIWQLTQYDKVIFIDSDLIVLENIDRFFVSPQISASGNDKYMFNSGVLMVEPSACMFEALMEKRFRVASYNGGDQGFLNEVFTWWHRWPARVNYLKNFDEKEGDLVHEMPENVYAMHYLGLKPWMCYEDYDCNWDMENHHLYASDSAHRRWWEVYQKMPERLRPYCGLTEDMDARIRKWRWRAQNSSLGDGHWKIEVRDPRRFHIIS